MKNFLTITRSPIGTVILQKICVFEVPCRCAIVAFFCLFSVSLHAQSTASIVGTVHDPSGALVVGATINIRNVDTGISRTDVTDDHGIYNISSIPIGHYSLSATQKGFKQAEVQPFELQVGQQARIDLTLVPGAVSETVSVTDATPQIQTDTSSVGQVVSVQQVSGLPLNSLHVAQLIGLTPGAIMSPLVGS